MTGQRSGTMGVGAELTAQVDWENLSVWVSGLDSGLRDRLMDALRHAETVQRYREIVDTVRDVLAREEPDRPAVAAVFTTAEWDNGYFLTATGRVLFDDGSADDVEFDHIDEVFTDDYVDNLFEHLGYVTAIAEAVAGAVSRQISVSTRRLTRTVPERRDEAQSLRALRVSVSGAQVIITGITNQDLHCFVVTALNIARNIVGSRSSLVGPLQNNQLTYWVTV
jgi:hypothetical protein